MTIQIDKNCKRQNEEVELTETFSQFAAAACNCKSFCDKRERCEDRLRKIFDAARKTSTVEVKRAGVCPHCHTYCNGDCRA